MTIALRFAAVCEEPSDIRTHLPRLRDLVVDTDAQVVVELGVRTGRSTTALLAGAEETGGLVWSCDVVNHGAPTDVTEHPQWEFGRGDDLAMAAHAPRPICVLFIDTSHEYEHTVAELRAYGPLVRSGGVIALHDTDETTWPACAQAVRHWFELLAPSKARLEFHPGDNGLTIIRL